MPVRELRDDLLSLVIATVVLFEVIGPVLTRMALMRVGEGEDRSA